MWTFVLFLIFLFLTVISMKNNADRGVALFGGITLLLFLIMTNFLGIGYLFSGGEEEIVKETVKHSAKWNIDTFWTWFYWFGFFACAADAFTCKNPVVGVIFGVIIFFVEFKFVFPFVISGLGAGAYGSYAAMGIIGWILFVIAMHVVGVCVVSINIFVYHFLFGFEIPPVVCSDIVFYLFSMYLKA